MTALEHRYRLLLRAYPIEHRRAYQEEMLGVLMDSSRPGQRWPSPQDAALLLRHGAAARLNGLRTVSAAGPWAHACAIFGLLTATLLSAHHVMVVVEQIQWHHRWPAIVPVHTEDVAVAAGWTLTLALILARQRRAAGATGILASLGGLYLQGRYVPQGWWPHSLEIVPITLGLVGAAALVVGARRREPAPSWPWLATLVLAASLMVGAYWSPLAGWTFMCPPLGLRVDDWLIIGSVPVLTWLGVLAFRVSGPVRRRLFALGAPLLTEFIYDNGSGGGRPLYIIGWFVVLACAIPPVTFAVGYVWVARRDRLLRLAALGRAAESMEPAVDPTGTGMLRG